MLPRIAVRNRMLTYHQGKYTVTADVFTKDGVHITCLSAKVQFNANFGL